MRLLGVVSLALFFEAYDLSMLTSALKHIATDLGMAPDELGGRLALIRLGALPAFALVPLTDRIGRRRMFLVSVVGVGLGTFLTAFSPNAAAFVAMQMVTRPFVLVGSAVAVVIVTEEFPAAHRGWGVGMLGALSACGHGLGALAFAAIDVLPWGWRSLYAFGAVPLLLLPVFRRGVPETDRFARRRNATPSRTAWHAPFLHLVRDYPGRAVGLALAGGLLAFGEVAVFQFTGYHTQTVHGWSPGRYSTMVIVGGAFGIVGNVVAGRLGDRVGRRLVGMGFMALCPLAAWVFYLGPSTTVPVAFALFVFCATASGVIVRALSTELFPTDHRGTSAGLFAVVQTLCWAAGLAAVGVGTDSAGDIARRTSVLSVAILAGGLVLLRLPETRRRELEAISPERI